MRNLFLVVVMTATMVLAGNAQVSTPRPMPPAAPELSRFDLDFPGGTPRDLVEALNKPLKGSLNVVMPADADDIQIPPIKLRQVNVQQVFDAVQRASERIVSFFINGNVQQQQENYRFDPAPGQPISENTVWAFKSFRPASTMPVEPPSSRFYQLSAYLDSMKIDDIITALQTGWEMLGQKGPTLKFHPETKLLIAVGKKTDFALIDDVLKELAKAPRMQSAMINGEVRKPGSVALSKDRKYNVIEAVERAGGPTPDADTNMVRFYRPGQPERVLRLTEPKSGQMILEPGDEIVVGRKQ